MSLPDAVPGWMHERVNIACERRGLVTSDVLAHKRRHQPLLQEIARDLCGRGASLWEIAFSLCYRSHASADRLLRPTTSNEVNHGSRHT